MSLTTVTGKFVDSNGNPILNGTVFFQAVTRPSLRPTSYTAGDGSVATTAAVSVPLVNTAPNAGTFTIQLEDALAASPTFFYVMTLQDPAGNQLLGPGYDQLQPTGANWALSSYVPSAIPGVSVVEGSQGPAGQSAYQLALSDGFVGTQAQYLASLVGAAGSINSPIPNSVVFQGNIAGRSFLDIPLTKPYGNVVAGLNVYGEPVISSCILPNGTLFGVTLAAPSGGGTTVTNPYTIDASGDLLVTKAITAPNLPSYSAAGANTRGLTFASVDANGSLLAATGPGGPISVSFPVATITPPPAAVAYEASDDAWNPLVSKPNLLYPVFIYGESLGSGADSSAYPTYNGGVTASQPFSNVGFSHNPTVGASGLSLVPLTDAANAPNAGGNTETAANGIADRLAYLVNQSTLAPLKVLVGNAAVPGYTYALLKQGTGPYNELLNQVTQAKSLAAAAGLVIAQPVIPFFHGYNDADAGQTTAQYYANIITLQQTLQTDIAAITGLSTPVRFLLFQCGYAVTALAQQQLALAFPDLFRIFGTSWQFQGAVQYQNAASGTSGSSANPLHLSPYDERFAGELATECLKDILQARPANPFRLQSMTVQEKVITLGFAGNIGPLRVDTSHVTNPGTLGFEIIDRRGTKILSATITGPSTITLQCDSYPVIGSATLGYAANLHGGMTGNPSWTGGNRGVIFDSRSALSYYPINGGATYPLSRALPMFTQAF